MWQPALNYQGPVATAKSRGELKDGSRSWIARVERSQYGTATIATLISRPRQKTGFPTMAASPAPGSASPYVALPVRATRSASEPGGMGPPYRSVPPLVPFRTRDFRTSKPGVRATTNALRYATGAVVRKSGPSLFPRSYRTARRGWSRITSESLRATDAKARPYSLFNAITSNPVV